MHDPQHWREEVSRKLANSKLSASEREEISRELAGYLEDLCSDAPTRGLDVSAVAQRAAAELHEDKHLGATLYRARKENRMYLNNPTKRFWLPGTAMLFLSVVMLSVLQLFDVHPYFTTISLRGGAAAPHGLYWPLMLNYPWLAMLPFLGAAAAYWSRRGGGSRAVQAAAGFLSIFVFFAAFLTVLLFSFVISGVSGSASVADTLSPEFVGAVISWVVIPAVALLLGVLPFIGCSALTTDR